MGGTNFYGVFHLYLSIIYDVAVQFDGLDKINFYESVGQIALTTKFLNNVM